MTRVLLVSGSQRRESYNFRLLRCFEQRLAVHARVDVLAPSDSSLPLFDQDLEADPAVIDDVRVLHQRFSLADGLIVASPEYNGQPTPYLKNIIDWVSRLAYIDPSFANPFQDRPLLLCSASTGASGGAVGGTHARALFGYVGSLVMGDTIFIPYVEQVWNPDADGFFLDPLFDAYIDTVLERFVRVAAALSPLRDPRRTE